MIANITRRMIRLELARRGWLLIRQEHTEHADDER